jgi:hypothetical protein
VIAQQQPSGVISHASNISDDCGVTGRNTETEEAGSRLRDGLTDLEREYCIKESGKRLEALHATYKASGCFNDAAARDCELRYMAALIRGRSPEQIQRMEAERGLT